MDVEKIKALIKVASESDDQDALDGVVELQELINEHDEMSAQLEALQAKYDADTQSLRDKWRNASDQLAQFIAKVGVGVEEESTKGKSREELYREYSLRGY